MTELLLALVVNVSLGQSSIKDSSEILYEYANGLANLRATQERLVSYPLYNGTERIDFDYLDEFCFHQARQFYLRMILMEVSHQQPLY